MGDRLPAAMTIAAKSMNMSMREFTKAMENGEISAREFMPAFSKAMQEMAEPGLERAFKSMELAFKRVRENFNLFVEDLFASGIGDIFTSLFDTLSNIFKVLGPFISFFGGLLTGILKPIVYTLEFATYWRDRS